MSSTTDSRKPARWYAIERSLAPHVDKKWRGRFILELRMLDIEGNRIGAALSEVESHCSESGQSAQEAFGDPVEYACSLHLPANGHESTRSLLRSSAPSLLQVLGMVLLTSSFADWLRGQQFEITTGILVNGSVVLLASVAITWFVDPALRMVIYHPIRMWLALMASTAIFVIPLIFLDEVIWQVSAGWVLAAGGAALAAGVVWAITQLRADGSAADLITSPFDSAGTSSGGAPGSTGRRFEPSRLAPC